MSQRFLRTSQVLLISVLALVAMGAGDEGVRFDKDSHSMMCVCGCNELLGACSDVGCPNRPTMLAQLKDDIGNGKSDDTIFREFEQQYGPVVLAAPMFTRFNHVAWIVPPLVLFLGIAVTLVIVRKWKFQAAPASDPPRTLAEQNLHERIRRETSL
jgi:cytochrome c-type biogenesis protein CcmH